jgi:LEA14-like dessication related protein
LPFAPVNRIRHYVIHHHRRRHRCAPLHLAGLFVFGAVAATGCVPFGGWLYDDPTFVLSELTLRGGGTPEDTLEMVLTACNRNDFPVQATGVVLSFAMDGSAVGSAESSMPVTLQTRDSTKMTVPLALPVHSSARPAMFSYLLTGYTTLQTPLGERRVELHQEGTVALKPRDEVAHIAQAGRPCRPGKSTLPGYMPIPVTAPPPPEPIPQPTSQPQR